MLYIESPARLAEILTHAANAHHEYERSLGTSDADWQHWYADWIFRTYAPRTRPLAATAETLTPSDL